MEELLLINPAKRRTKRRAPTKRRAAASPKRRIKRRSSVLATNPAPRRRRHHRAPAAVRVSRRRYRRNPDSRLGVKDLAMPALQGAAGGIALDFIMGLSIIPASLKTGPMKHIVKAAGAMAIGIAAKQFLGGAVASNMAKGAMIVAFHDGIKEVATSAGVNLSGVGYYPPQQLAAYPRRTKIAGIPDVSNGYMDT